MMVSLQIMVMVLIFRFMGFFRTFVILGCMRLNKLN